MKWILLWVILLGSFVLASANEENISKKEERTQEAIKKALEDEAKYAREKRFYDMHSYDFKGSEVNEESVKTLKKIEPMYDFNMDHVYD